MTDVVRGRLYVNVMEGRDIKVVSGYTPFATVTVYGIADKLSTLRMYKTDRVNKKAVKAPSWDKPFTIAVDGPLSMIEVAVWGGKSKGEDKFLGQHIFDLYSFCDQEQYAEWVQLYPRNEGDDNITGEVRVKVHYKFIDDWNREYEAMSAIEQRQWHVAHRILSELVHLRNIDVPALLYYRSTALLGLHRYQDALIDAAKLIELCPSSANGYLKQGRAYLGMLEFADAKRCFQTACKVGIEPGDMEEYLEGNIELDRAFSKFKVTQNIKSGKLSFAGSDFESAVIHFTKAIELNPHNAVLLIYRAVCHLGMGRIDLATQDAMQVTNIHADWPRIGCMKQGTLEKRGNLNTSMKRRWFVLREVFLYYYTDEKETLPSGVIPLYGVNLQTRRRTEFSICLPKRNYELRAVGEDERADWLAVIDKIRNQPLALPVEAAENIIFFQENQGGKMRKILQPLRGVQKMSNSLGMSVGGNKGHIKTLVAMDSPDYSGWLLKKHKKEWQRRWFVKKGDTLLYTEHRPREGAPISPSGMVEGLQRATFKVVSETNFSFEVITTVRTFELCAENAADFEEWTNLLGGICQEIDSGLVAETLDARKRVRVDPSHLRVKQPTEAKNVDKSPAYAPRRLQPDQISRSEMQYFEKYAIAPPDDFVEDDRDDALGVPLDERSPILKNHPHPNHNGGILNYCCTIQ